MNSVENYNSKLIIFMLKLKSIFKVNLFYQLWEPKNFINLFEEKNLQ